MNNLRRAILTVCEAQLSYLKTLVESTKATLNKFNNLKSELDLWSSIVDRQITDIERVENGEQAALDAIPDSFQMGDIANSIEDALYEIRIAKDKIASLKDSIDIIEDVYIQSFLATYRPDSLIEELESIIEEIDEAKEHVEEAKS